MLCTGHSLHDRSCVLHSQYACSCQICSHTTAASLERWPLHGQTARLDLQDKNEKLKQQLQAASVGGQGSEARLAEKDAQIQALQVCDCMLEAMHDSTHLNGAPQLLPRWALPSRQLIIQIAEASCCQ